LYSVGKETNREQMMNDLQVTILAILLSTTMPNYAEEAKQTNWGVLLPAISVTSDVRFNGMSLSNREPAIQGSLHWWRPDNFYAGIWLSQVDFQDAGGTSIEFDTYAGRNFYSGDTEFKVEVLYSAFNDNGPGPTYDFLQFKLGTKRNIDNFSIGIAVLWAPEGSAGSGIVRQLRSESTYNISDNLMASATLGRKWAEHGSDRTYWDIGFTLSWKKLYFDIRYVDTNAEKSECFYTDWCEGAVVTKLTLASY
jgi:uncharacterized protein (TIGR02001 family)